MTATFPDIQAAAERLKGRVVTTPVLEAPLLNEALGFRLFVKAECLQRTGSFKLRGAMNTLLQLSDAEKAKGVVAFSSGNHAQGVAYAAQQLGVKAVIVMPKTAPALKIANTRAYGAEVVLYDPVTESREELGDKLSKERGLVMVKPYDDPRIIAGQGTAGLELSAQLKEQGVTPDVFIAPCSGGGLSSGTSLAMKHAFPHVNMFTAEPEGFDDMKRSLASGKLEVNACRAPSICDALLATTPGDFTFPILKQLGAQGVAVSDKEALKAIGIAARYLKITLEPGGAVAFAAAIFGKLPLRGKTVAVIASGGNGDPDIQGNAIRNYSELV